MRKEDQDSQDLRCWTKPGEHQECWDRPECQARKTWSSRGEGMTQYKVYKAAPGRTHKEDNCRQEKKRKLLFQSRFSANWLRNRAFRGGREPSLVCPGSAGALHSTLQGSWGTQKIAKQDAWVSVSRRSRTQYRMSPDDTRGWLRRARCTRGTKASSTRINRQQPLRWRRLPFPLSWELCSFGSQGYKSMSAINKCLKMRQEFIC